MLTFRSISPYFAEVAQVRSRFWAAQAAKIWSKPKKSLRHLQVLEIAQNRQRNVWKSLEEKGVDLEKLAEKAWWGESMAAAPQVFGRRRQTKVVLAA
jgi:hypothetical protein